METDRYNASELLEANLIAGRADNIAIYCGESSFSYAEVFERACRIGRGLKALGVRREERVLLVLDDGPDFVASFFGAIRMGAVPVLVSPLYPAADLQYCIEASTPRAIVGEAEKAGEIREALSELGFVDERVASD